jgi:hypothetical protein
VGTAALVAAWQFASPLVQRSAAPMRRRVGTAVFALPLVAVLAIPLALPQISHSFARGAQEVASAIARGSLSGDPLARAGELVSTFGLAALPLFAFGAVGFVLAVRKPTTALRYLHVPALVYLAAILVLVALGAYTGSHRYLYPALPSLALLAAAALDRHSSVVRVASVAAAGLLAVSFIPVFSSFAAANAGLVAAGRAASGSPGMLVTDSPVVAFYSGKQPDQVTGSQVLPLDRDQAVAWIREHNVSELVVENISYYRATSVFPDLAAGSPAPPFELLGDQRYYNAAGGKPVYAYRVGAALDQQSLFPGVDAAVQPEPREGKTALLAKGLALIVGGSSAAGEGMGFGVPIVHYPDGWVFPRTVTTIDLSTEGQAMWRRTFELDEIGGDALPGGGFDFAPIASRGRIEVTYTVVGSEITVEVKTLDLQPGYSQVTILNEQSGAFDDFADSSTTLIGRAFGRWVPVDGAWARLRAGALDVEWSVPAIPGAQLFGGREVTAPSFDWAGLDYVFSGPFTGATYRIHVQEAR